MMLTLMNGGRSIVMVANGQTIVSVAPSSMQVPIAFWNAWVSQNWDNPMLASGLLSVC